MSLFLMYSNCHVGNAGIAVNYNKKKKIRNVYVYIFYYVVNILHEGHDYVVRTYENDAMIKCR